MQFSVTIGAERKRIGDGVRAPIGETDTMMHFEIRRAVSASKGGRILAAFAMAICALKDGCDHVRIALIADALHNDRGRRGGGDRESRHTLRRCARLAPLDSSL